MLGKLYDFFRLKYVALRNFYFLVRRLPYMGVIRNYFKKDTSIISSNCFSGRIMQDFKMQYNSPTLGLWIMPSDFPRFCADLPKYLASSVEIVDKSKNDLGNYKMTHAKHPYPVGVLGGDIEIHFLHYDSGEEACEKWERRSKRVNLNDYMLMGFEQNGCSEDDIRAFDSINHERKIFFASKPYNYASVVYIPEFSSLGYVGDPYKKSYIYYRYLASWIKSQKNYNETN